MKDFKIEIYASQLKQLLNKLDKLRKENKEAKSLNEYLFKELETLKNKRHFDAAI